MQLAIRMDPLKPRRSAAADTESSKSSIATVLRETFQKYTTFCSLISRADIWLPRFPTSFVTSYKRPRSFTNLFRPWMMWEASSLDDESRSEYFICSKISAGTGPSGNSLSAIMILSEWSWFFAPGQMISPLHSRSFCLRIAWARSSRSRYMHSAFRSAVGLPYNERKDEASPVASGPIPRTHHQFPWRISGFVVHRCCVDWSPSPHEGSWLNTHRPWCAQWDRPRY